MLRAGQGGRSVAGGARRERGRGMRYMGGEGGNMSPVAVSSQSFILEIAAVVMVVLGKRMMLMI